MKGVITVYLSFILLVSACSSGKDAVQEAFDNLPGPAAQNGQAQDLGPQSIEESVPSIEEEASYHGLLELKINESIEFFLVDGKSMQIVDLEFRPTENVTLEFNDKSTSYQGCSSWSSTTTWMEVDEEGEILDLRYLGIFDSWEASQGSRYIMRLTYNGVSDCLSFFNSLKVIER